MSVRAAIVTGSVVKCGVEACPPAPLTVMWKTSAAAMIAPGRPAIQPAGQFGVMCSA